MAECAADKQKTQILFELLSSSSSDSEEENFLLKGREEHPEIKNFIENVVHKYSDVDFKKNLRLSRATTHDLISKFEGSCFYNNNKSHGGRVAITAEKHVLSFLWFAGNKSSLRDVAERFDISVSSLHTIVERVTDYLIQIAPSIIYFPNNEEEKEATAANFKKISGFPGVLGCIDGTSINIRTPAHKLKSTYTNRHDVPSITLQGICDHQRKFVDVFTGPPGKIHDARVFKLSDVSKKITRYMRKEISHTGRWGILHQRISLNSL